jgi:3-hydroxybutyryl-CoA dehydrogenase
MKKINIIGCGLMGSQIASLFSIMGYEVNIWNRTAINESNLSRQKKITLKLLKTKDNNGKINIIKKFDDIKNNITIESLSEDIDLKKNYFNKLREKISKEIFTNSSSIKTDKINEELNLLHFFNPIYLRVIEYKTSGQLSDEAKIIFSDLSNMDFELVEVGNFTGYAFNKVLFSQISNFFFLIERENIKKEKILKIFKKVNNNLDVLNTIDLIGTDVSLKILENLKEEYNYYIPEILYICRERKIYGKKNKSTIKSIFNSHDYPKIKNER